MAQSAAQVQKILIMEKMENALLRYQDFLNSRQGTGDYALNLLRAKSALKVLLYSLKPRMARLAEKSQEYSFKPDEITKSIEDDKLGDVIDALLDYLENDLRLTKIDTRKNYDRTDVEAENMDKGL